MSLSVIAAEAFPLRYLLQTQTDFGRKLSITERLTYKPGKVLMQYVVCFFRVIPWRLNFIS